MERFQALEGHCSRLVAGGEDPGRSALALHPLKNSSTNEPIRSRRTQFPSAPAGNGRWRPRPARSEAPPESKAIKTVAPASPPVRRLPDARPSTTYDHPVERVLDGRRVQLPLARRDAGARTLRLVRTRWLEVAVTQAVLDTILSIVIVFAGITGPTSFAAAHAERRTK